jgi:hypothetical protein
MGTSARTISMLIAVSCVSLCCTSCAAEQDAIAQSKQKASGSTAEGRGFFDALSKKKASAAEAEPSSSSNDLRYAGQVLESRLKKQQFVVTCGDSVYFYSPTLGLQTLQTLGNGDKKPTGIVQGKKVNFYTQDLKLSPADRENGKEVDGWFWMHTPIFREYTSDDGWSQWKDGEALRRDQVEGMADNQYVEHGVFFRVAVGKDKGKWDFSAFDYFAQKLYIPFQQSCAEMEKLK